VSARVVAWGICIATLLVVAATATLTFLNRESIHGLDEATTIEIVLPIGYAILGALVASRQPRNAMGWLFLAIALANAIPGLTTQYSRYALVTDPGAPFTPWIPWFGYMTSSLVYPAGLAPIALLLIPNGRLPSPRWGWVVVAGILLTAMLMLVAILDPSMLEYAGLAGIPNPTGASGLERITQGVFGTWGFLAGLGVLAAAGASVVLRLIRARGEERLQLRWVAYAVAFAVALNIGFTLVSLIFLPMETVASLSVFVVIIGFGIAMPVGFAVAMLRYRLFDLDLILNRTILYSAVSAVLLVVFGVANVLAQRAVESWIDQRSDMVSAAVGLGAGLAFGPVRRWLRPLVDRALPARSRLTLLFTDIVESTQAIVDLGDEQWRDVLDRYRAIVRAELARCHGREVNTAGDAFFAAFDRPANAVRCAVAMRDGVAALGLRVRTGLHIGDVEMRGEQVSGLAVHAAARVMGQAKPGEILVSGELAAVLPSLSLRDAGHHVLRGVPGEWQLFELAGVTA
jgi:class 3 adenylate cyclase